MRCTVLVLALLGCSSETRPAANADAGASGDVETDDADARDAAPLPWRSGKILDGGHFFIGVTSDDWLAAHSLTTPSAKAVSLRGASESALPAMMQYRVDGPAVFAWASTLSPLQVWTAANGVQKLTERGDNAGGAFAADAEGRRVAFIDGATGGNLTISSATGTDRINLGPAYNGCGSRLQFVGDRLVASYCKAKGVYGVTVFDKTGKIVQSVPGYGFDVSAKGDILLFATSGPAHVLANGSSTLVKVADSVQHAVITRDGAAVLYFDAARDLHRTPSSAASPIKLAANVARFTVSHDGARVLLSSNGDGSDLAVASAVTPGAAEPIATDARYVAFTIDDRYIVYTTAAGTLNARATAGGAARSLGSDVTNFLVAEGSSIAAIRASGELLLGDVADPTPLKIVATGVEQLLLTADATHLLYGGRSSATFIVPVR
jgi:hypothetical protein